MLVTKPIRKTGRLEQVGPSGPLIPKANSKSERRSHQSSLRVKRPHRRLHRRRSRPALSRSKSVDTLSVPSKKGRPLSLTEVGHNLAVDVEEVFVRGVKTIDGKQENRTIPRHPIAPTEPRHLPTPLQRVRRVPQLGEVHLCALWQCDQQRGEHVPCCGRCREPLGLDSSPLR